MLPRVLEPEVMDSDIEAHAYDAMDHTDVNRVFVADFLAIYTGAGPVLDVGTGTAQIPIELCRQHPTIRVTAIDAAATMLELARVNIEQAGFADRITVQLVDAKRLPFPDASFSAVMSNSIVHHIPEPRTALAEMARVAKTVLFVRDLLRPNDDKTVHALVERYAAGANDYQRALFDASLRAAFSLEEIREIADALGFDRDAVQRTTDRHWTWSTCRVPCRG